VTQYSFPVDAVIIALLAGIIVFLMTKYYVVKSLSGRTQMIVGILVVIVFAVLGHTLFAQKSQGLTDAEINGIAKDAAQGTINKINELAQNQKVDPSAPNIYEEGMQKSKTLQLSSDFPKELVLDSSAILTDVTSDKANKSYKVLYQTKKALSDLVTLYDVYLQKNSTNLTKSGDQYISYFKGIKDNYNFVIEVGSFIDDSGRFISIEIISK
jgi:hypothetical protein